MYILIKYTHTNIHICPHIYTHTHSHARTHIYNGGSVSWENPKTDPQVKTLCYAMSLSEGSALKWIWGRSALDTLEGR